MSFSVEEGGPIGFTAEIEFTNQANSWDIRMLQMLVSAYLG